MDDLSKLDGYEKKKLLDMATGIDRIIVILLLDTGLDIDQLINLRVSDLDMNSGLLRVSENRAVHLSNKALFEIKEHIKSRPGQIYLLEGRCGKPVTSKWKRCILESLLAKSRQEA